ncbi:MAG: twin-arginine translocase TatA/TatE family subunit [Rhodospirillaceae bacterium]
MGTFSIWHWLVVLVVVLVLFGGGGKISRLMGDFGKGLKSFKKSMKEDDDTADAGGADRKAIDGDGKDSAKTAPAAEKDKAAG